LPKGIAVGSSSTVYVADTANNRIEEWAAAKVAGEPPTYATSFTPPNNIEGSFREPDAVALDPSGNIWIADSGHDRVIEFNSKHEYLRQFGSEGTAEGQFKAISGIAANAAGDVYVTDYGNNRVQEFSPTGGFLRQFGSSGLRIRPAHQSDRHRGRPERQRVGAEQLRR
jgi:tripartite motif-containing protein 71